MRRLIVIGLAAALVASLATDADARRRRRSRLRQSVRSTPTRTVVRQSVRSWGGSPQAAASAKLSAMVQRGRFAHLGGGFGGANAEGIGMGPTPAAALGNCCFTGRRKVAGSAVRRVGRSWWALKLYW